MSAIKEFKERLIAASEFAAKFRDAKTAEEVVELAKAEGFEITAAELDELADDELKGVAGGFLWPSDHPGSPALSGGTHKWITKDPTEQA
jgi:predicted ribosomally synthesized peptide with nif11-like leader